jgi:hypothetical protein
MLIILVEKSRYTDFNVDMKDEVIQSQEEILYEDEMCTDDNSDALEEVVKFSDIDTWHLKFGSSTKVNFEFREA